MTVALLPEQSALRRLVILPLLHRARVARLPAVQLALARVAGLQPRIAWVDVARIVTGLQPRVRGLTPAAEERAEPAAAVVLACHVDVGGRLARDEAALRLIVQHHDEFGAVVGFLTQRLV